MKTEAIMKHLEMGQQILARRMGLHSFGKVKRPVQIAVVDSGFDLSHPYLHKRLSFLDGWNAEGVGHSLNEAELLDAYWGNTQEALSSHGTHLAGIIAQSVSPEVSIIPVRVGSWDSWIVNSLNPHNEANDKIYSGGRYREKTPFDAAFEELMKRKVQVINISWRINYADPVTEELLIGLAEADKLMVLAAGNDSITLGEDKNTEAFARLVEHPRIMGRILVVCASTDFEGDEWMAPFSNRPNEEAAPYTIWAPGADILSSAPLKNTPKGVEYKSGTSMAAGVVTGILGQMLGENPTLSVDQAKKALLSSTKTIYGVDIYTQTASKKGCGCGLIQAQKALAAAKEIAEADNGHHGGDAPFSFMDFA